MARELRKLRDQADSPEIQREGPDHEAWKAKVDAVMQGGLGPDSETLRKFRDHRYHVGVWTGAPGEASKMLDSLPSGSQDAAALVDAAIYQLELEDSPDEGGHVALTGPIFVVHGHDNARKYELMRLLDRTVDLPAIVLHEQPNKGATILEKFERHAESASFAIVLLTGDDEGRLRGGDRPLAPVVDRTSFWNLACSSGCLGENGSSF